MGTLMCLTSRDVGEAVRSLGTTPICWRTPRRSASSQDRMIFPSHWPGLRETGERNAAVAAGAGEHVLAEDPHQQLGPGNARWIRVGLGLRGGLIGQWSLGRRGR